MAEPVIVDIPHKLGRETARARIAGGIGKLTDIIPGGGSVEQRWDGDTLHFNVSAMGQKVGCRLDVLENKVHAELDLPPMLAMFAGKIRDKLLGGATKLLK